MERISAVERRHQMRFGAETKDNSTLFRLWAPKCKTVKLELKGRREPVKMEQSDDGFHRVRLDGLGAGTRYRFILPDGQKIGDSAARFQPDPADGYSEVIDPTTFRWTDSDWRGLPWEQTVIYELHVGAFTTAGTFSAIIKHLDHLKTLGVTAIQLMPIAQFYGQFNWGYDGTFWFAPAASYGRPDDLRALVDAAHGRGMMVFLDVVYNHLGKVGNNLPTVAPVLSKRHKGPWGAAMNFDEEGSDTLREFVIDSATCWLTEFNLDGLRFDATQAMIDTSNTHILDVLSARLRAIRPNRETHLIIENSDNCELWLRRDALLRSVQFTAQWNDDLHHVVHSALTGENTGYYTDFENYDERCEKLGRALAEGFVYQGEYKQHEAEVRGEPSRGLPATAFVNYLQNHDQIGNRAAGDRITSVISEDQLYLAAALYLLAPEIPMIFMGEEWAASTPFPFFSDAPKELREKIVEGRLEQLKESSPDKKSPAPDPTSVKTFRSAKLKWAEVHRTQSQKLLNHYRTLLDLRHHEIVPRLKGMKGFQGCFRRIGPNAVSVDWTMGDGSILHLCLNLSDETVPDCPASPGRRIWMQGFHSESGLGPWSLFWSIELAGTKGRTPG